SIRLSIDPVRLYQLCSAVVKRSRRCDHSWWLFRVKAIDFSLASIAWPRPSINLLCSSTGRLSSYQNTLPDWDHRSQLLRSLSAVICRLGEFISFLQRIIQIIEATCKVRRSPLESIRMILVHQN